MNLGVKGGSQCPVLVTTKWTTPPGAGHYCLQVAFGWVDDSNPTNNLGQENTQVGTSHSPVSFQFQLRNQKRSEQRFRFETDCYTIPPLPPCGERPSNIRTGRGAVTQRPFDSVTVPPRHQRTDCPLPRQAGRSPSRRRPPTLAAGQEIAVGGHGRAAGWVHGTTTDRCPCFYRIGARGRHDLLRGRELGDRHGLPAIHQVQRTYRASSGSNGSSTS